MSMSQAELYKDVALNPSKHHFGFRPLVDCFEESNTVNGLPYLYHFYNKNEFRSLPQSVFCLAMYEVFGSPTERDNGGNLGYKLKFKDFVKTQIIQNQIAALQRKILQLQKQLDNG